MSPQDTSGADLHQLSWFANGDRLEVALLANRLAAAGREVRRAMSDAAGLEAGDYLVRLGPLLVERLREAGFAVEPWRHAVPADTRIIRHTRIAVLAGHASAYPYYGYYALALTCLGYAYSPVDGAGIAGGALDGESVAILPGGFANWGLDSKEETVGADAAFRRFLGEGGVAVASCGGSFYLARGRPAWLGVADVRPVFTQEYLRTGVGVVTCGLAPGPMRLGLPPTLEIPYFHGPVFDELGSACEPVATFRELYGHGRLFIDNPLGRETFERHMRDRVAALSTSGPRGRAVLFSPHPEMGDLLRKYMALETYIPRYLPVRGDIVMRETLRSYAPAQSRSFLLILNAVEHLLHGAPERLGSRTDPDRVDDGALDRIPQLRNAWRDRSRTVRPSGEPVGALERDILDGLEARLDPALDRLAAALHGMPAESIDAARIRRSVAALVGHIVASWADPPARRPAELLLELELALLLVESWARLAEVDRLVCHHE